MKQKLLSLGLSLALVLGLAAGCAPKAGHKNRTVFPL